MAQQDDGPEAEKLSDALFRLLVESVKDYAIFHLDPAGYIRSWNEGAQRIKGYVAREIIGKHFSIFYSPQEQRRGKPEYELRVAAEEGRWEEEGWRVRKDGTYFWANVVITALFDAQGQLVGYAKVTRDLTERKHADEERAQLLVLERTARAETEATLRQLRSLQGLMETALTHLTVADLPHVLLDRIASIMEVDLATLLLPEGDECAMLVTHATPEIVHESRIELAPGLLNQITHDDRPARLDAMVRDQHLRPLLAQTAIRTSLGVTLTIEQQILGVLYVGTRHDRRFGDADLRLLQNVADRVALAIYSAQLYETARKAQAEADLASAKLRAQDEFLSVAAHELKTPMTSVKAASQLLMRRFARTENPDPQLIQRTLKTVEQQVDKFARLVTQLLETVRLGTGRLSLNREQTDVGELIRTTVEQMRMQAAEQHFIVSVAGTVWAKVDALRIEQVIMNLLDNAIRFSPDHNPIEVTAEQAKSGEVRMTIRDYGIGIPEEHRPFMFQRFYQAHADSNRSGLGLGLYISQDIIRQHGGEITIEHPPDGGTSFVVTLPVDDDAPTQPGEDTEQG